MGGLVVKRMGVGRFAALGWRARIPLAEGLASTVSLHLEELRAETIRRQ